MCEDCNLFEGTIQNNSWISFIADTTIASLQVTVSDCTLNEGIQIGIYSGNNCNNFQILSNPDFTSGTNYTNANSTFTLNVPYNHSGALVKGQEYYIMVDGMGGDVCNYSIKALSGVSVISAGNNQTICIGESAQLQAKGGTVYQWSHPENLSNTNISNPIATPTVTTIYTVTVTGGNSQCPQSNIDSVTVFVNALNIVYLETPAYVPAVLLCLSALGANTYTWSPATGLSTTTGSTVTANPTSTTTYTVNGKTNGGCFKFTNCSSKC